MALYTYTMLDAIPEGFCAMMPGTAACLPISLTAGQRLNIDLVHVPLENSADWTIRGWISKLPLGNPDAALPQFVQTWQPNKVPGIMVVSFFDRSSEADRFYAIPADPGKYILNVLNLANTPNQFSLTIVDTTATDDSPS